MKRRWTLGTEAKQQTIYRHLLKMPRARAMALEALSRQELTEDLLEEALDDLFAAANDDDSSWRRRLRSLEQNVENHLHFEEDHLEQLADTHLDLDGAEELAQLFEYALKQNLRGPRSAEPPNRPLDRPSTTNLRS